MLQGRANLLDMKSTSVVYDDIAAFSVDWFCLSCEVDIINVVFGVITVYSPELCLVSSNLNRVDSVQTENPLKTVRPNTDDARILSPFVKLLI